MDKDIQIRIATIKDIKDIIKLRENLFTLLGEERSSIVNSRSAMQIYFETSIAKGDYIGWLAYHNNKPVASGGLVFHYYPPTPTNLTGKSAYIMNISTLPEYQKKGIGKRIMETIIEYVRENNVKKVTLHSTKAGKRLYSKLGFKDSPEMTLRL